MDKEMEREINMTEEEFLKQYDASKYPRPSVTVDVLIFNRKASGIEILLIQRKNHPFQGKWAIPGGFINMNENLDDAAYRELQEETGIDGRKEGIPIEQIYTFGDVGRDPRTRVITVAYAAVLEGSEISVKADDDAADARWYPVDKLPSLAFDHDKVITCGLKKLNLADKKV